MSSLWRLVLLAASAALAFGREATTTTTTEQNLYYEALVESLPSLQGRCVAITGTTSGLGYWAAVATARKGPSCLIMLNRNSSRAVAAEEAVKREAAPGVAVHTVTCDLQSFDSVRAAAARVLQLSGDFGGLDVLALNAGIMGADDARTGDGLDVMMQTNHVSHFLLTKLLLPALRGARDVRGEARIVTQSSLARGHNVIYEGGGAIEAKYYETSPAGGLGGNGSAASRERYHQSKMANALFGMALHSRLARNESYANVKALVAAPGFAKTHLSIPAWLDHDWIENLIALSAPDGSCPLLTAMFEPSSKSGDFYEPEHASNGPPSRVVAEAVPAPRNLARRAAFIRDSEICEEAQQITMWKATEIGLGESFVVDSGVASMMI